MVKEDETQKILDAYVTATHLGLMFSRFFFGRFGFSGYNFNGNVLRTSETGRAPILNLKEIARNYIFSGVGSYLKLSMLSRRLVEAIIISFKKKKHLSPLTSDIDDHVCTKRGVSSDPSPHRSKIPRIHSGKFPPKLLAEQRSNFREVFLSQ